MTAKVKASGAERTPAPVEAKANGLDAFLGELDAICGDLAKEIAKRKASSPVKTKDEFSSSPSPTLFSGTPGKPSISTNVGRTVKERERAWEARQKKQNKEVRSGAYERQAKKLEREARENGYEIPLLGSSDAGAKVLERSIARSERTREANRNDNNWYRNFVLRNDRREDDRAWLLAGDEVSGGIDRKTELDAIERIADRLYEDDLDIDKKDDVRRAEAEASQRKLEMERSLGVSDPDRPERDRDRYYFNRDYGREHGWPDKEY